MAGKKGTTRPYSKNKTALKPLIELDPERTYGPAMSKLSDPRKRFVLAFVLTGGRNQTEAARWAGIGGTDAIRQKEASRIMHNQAVLDALREETDMFFRGGVLRAGHVLLELLDSEVPKVRLDAAKELLNRGGMIVASQQNITVEHIESRSTAELIDFVEKYQSSLPKLTHASTLPASEAVFQEGEFENVDENVVQLRPGDEPFEFLPNDSEQEPMKEAA